MTTATKPAERKTDDRQQHIAEIRRTLDIFHRPGDVAEIRILGIPGRGKPHAAAGYFDDFQAAAESAVEYDEHANAAGIYFVMNQVNPALLARSPNRITRYPENTTTDNYIQQRHFLLIDLDPSRPAGIGSTDAQLQAARDVAKSVREWLAAQYWSEPIEALSANGIHLDYPISLPNDDDSKRLIETVLKVLDSQFSTEAVSVDKGVFNAARITKLYGTTVRKGHSMADRPHRRSRLLYVPDYLEPGMYRDCDAVPVERLQAVADMWQAPKPKPPTTRTQTYDLNIPGANPSGNGSRLLVDEWLRDRSVAFTVKPFSDGRTGYLLANCPFDANHGGNGEVMVAQEASGKLSAKCMHNSCTGRGWQEFKEAIGEPDRDRHYDPPLRQQVKLERRQQPIPTQTETEAEQPKFLELIDCKTLLSLDLRPCYLVKNVLVANQPAVVGGRSKVLKTSIVTDLVVSLGSGTDFLGEFPAKQCHVAFWSGESGAGTLRETARRVAKSRDVELRDCSILWGFSLPKLSRDDHLQALAETITERELDVVVVDPLYLAMLDPTTAGLAGNIYAMGSLLQPLGEIGQNTGCTILVLHHFKKSGQVDPNDPAPLDELSQSGIVEWCRQWILLQRRESYAGDGHHELFMRCGGSTGHAGLYALDIDEGIYDPDKPDGGRFWEPVLLPIGDAREQTQRDQERKKAEQREERGSEDQRKMLEALRRCPEGETKNVLRELAGLSGARAADALRTLIGEGRAEMLEMRKATWKGTGYKPTGR